MTCDNPECRATEAKLRSKIREIWGAYTELQRAWEAILDRVDRMAKFKALSDAENEYNWQLRRHLEEIKRLEKESASRRTKLRSANRKIKALKERLK